MTQDRPPEGISDDMKKPEDVTEGWFEVGKELEREGVDPTRNIISTKGQSVSGREKAKLVLVFGCSGVGKTTLVNALAGTEFTVGGGVAGVTFEAQEGRAERDGTDYVFLDTTGLRQASGGEREKEATMADFTLRNLVNKCSGRICLLLMVVRKGRITDDDYNNYKLFHDAITRKSVPIVIVATHCEDEYDLVEWAQQNVGIYRERGMACSELVPTTYVPNTSLGPIFNVEVAQELRSESTERVWQAIGKYASDKPINFTAKLDGISEIVISVSEALASAREAPKALWKRLRTVGPK